MTEPTTAFPFCFLRKAVYALSRSTASNKLLKLNLRGKGVLNKHAPRSESRAEIASAPRFAVGDRVRMRRDNPPTPPGCRTMLAAAPEPSPLRTAVSLLPTLRPRAVTTSRSISTRSASEGGSKSGGRNAEAGCAVYLDLYRKLHGKRHDRPPTCRGAPAHRVSPSRGTLRHLRRWLRLTKPDTSLGRNGRDIFCRDRA